jgi:phenylacetate-CoA ligase
MPLHKWLITKNAKKIYLDLKEIEFATAQEIDEYQINKINRLLHHVSKRVPYYRKKVEESDLPVTVEFTSDLSVWPMLSKSDVRNNLYFDLFSENHRKSEMHKISTSGSTGQPFTTYADRHQLEFRFATTLRALEWTGWRFGDKQARLWHQTLGMSWSQVIRERLDALFMRRLFIPAFDITPQNLEKFVGKIRKHKPVLVDGYAESLNFLATYVSQGNNPGFTPKAMMSSAQALPDNVRDRIENGFHTRVFDKYGSREFSGIAYQCETSNDHHVMAESYVVELVTDGRPTKIGETGEILITDLNNYSVPLIRYRVGDLAEAVDNSKPCTCGRSLPRIGKIQGRTQAIVICAEGKWMPGTFFAHFFKDYEEQIQFFQIHQREAGTFTLKVVKGTLWTQEAFDEVIKKLSKHVGYETDVEIDFVDEIPMLKTGKRSPVVSEVNYDFQEL